jgi:isopentenyl-diphosphate Delta-isomerase
VLDNHVILVNENDEPTGAMEKIEAHRKARLHRAFSIFIFNHRGEMLLQQRAMNKYHSAGLWTNACCSHPQPYEDTLLAAERRLQEEMGFSVPLKKILAFVYKSEFENGLTEYEYDHVFVGNYDELIKPNADEVKDYCFKTMEAIKDSLATHPLKYTSWFHIAFPLVEQWQQQQFVINEVV